MKYDVRLKDGLQFIYDEGVLDIIKFTGDKNLWVDATLYKGHIRHTFVFYTTTSDGRGEEINIHNIVDLFRASRYVKYLPNDIGIKDRVVIKPRTYVDQEDGRKRKIFWEVFHWLDKHYATGPTFRKAIKSYIDTYRGEE